MPDNLTALATDSTAYGMLKALANIFLEVVFFWQLRVYAWWTWKSEQDVIVDSINEAQTYEQWETAAFRLDELRANDLWRQTPSSKFYDFRLIYERLRALVDTREDEDILGTVDLMRSGLVRNLGNITTPGLFNRAYAGTKLLIEDYVTEVAFAVSNVAGYPTSISAETGLTSQAKLDVLHDTRAAYGRTAVILQGGAVFGLCHIGVVKALHLRGLLPRIIVGSATGALIAALVGVHTEDELLEFLTGERIDLTAFGTNLSSTGEQKHTYWVQTLYRRVIRLFRHGYLLDARVLEECVRSNVGDMTFEEAYARTRRVLNITVAASKTHEGSVPGLLNYITAPNVLIWSAAAASNTGDGSLYSPVTLLCKTAAGEIQPWSHGPSTPASNRKDHLKSSGQMNVFDTPMSRVAELFNVNHFIISQARPSIAPFLQTTADTIPRQATAMSRKYDLIWQPLRRVLVLELRHRLTQMSTLGVLPAAVARFVLEENLPGDSLAIVPELKTEDFVNLLERPTKDNMESWILRGERSIWPAISALRIRCAIEFELDRAYQLVRRRKPLDAAPWSSTYDHDSDVQRGQRSLRGGGEKRRRKRTKSASDHSPSETRLSNAL